MLKNKNHNISELHNAFLSLRNSDEVRRFLIDLCTPGEIDAFAERWAIARTLHKDQLGYREIATEIGSSTTTVARVARFLRHESYGGYRLVLTRIKEGNSE